MRYVIGTVKGKRSKKVTQIKTLDSLTMACVEYDEYVMHLASKRTTGITVLLADSEKKTLLKAHQF